MVIAEGRDELRKKGFFFAGVVTGSSVGKESACSEGNLGSILGLGRSLGEENGYTLQYSGLENPMDCITHGVTKSWTQLSDFPFHFLSSDQSKGRKLQIMIFEDLLVK